MRFMTTALALSVFMLISAPAEAASWYVATNGSDTNPGTLAAPFATINKGVSKLDYPGDMLYVRGGTYNQLVTVWGVHGSQTSPIYIQPYNGETVVIDGTGFTGVSAVVGLGQSSWVRFDSFEVKNGIEAGIKVYDSNNIKVRWNKVHDNQKFGIVVATASASAFGTAHHVLVEGNDVYRNVLNNSAKTATSGWTQGIGTLRAEEVDIVDNYVFENYGEGIDCVLTNGCRIVNNTVYDNYGTNIYLDNATNVLVNRNFCMSGRVSNYLDYYRNNHGAHGISLANEFYTINGASTQNPLNHIKITNNIVVNGGHGVLYRDSYYGGGLHDTLVANNTFYGSSTHAPVYIEGTTVHDTTTIQNNIVYASGTSYAYAPSAAITWGYNTWYNGTANTHKSGPGDILANPLLVNAGTGTKTDYQLQSTSPCINTGTTLSAVTTDYWGQTRGTQYDIGADEY